jgi:RNA polymerase sigma factor (sigma-70 family)
MQTTASALAQAVSTPPVSPSASVEQQVAAAARGDRHAWNALVNRYSGLVWSVARAHRLNAADSADVVQTTWLRLIEHIGALHDPARVGSWLATTARRECLRILRHTTRCAPTEEVPEPAPTEDEAIDARLLAQERDATLWEAFSRLPARDQALLRLLSSDPPASYQEIAAALDMPVGSIGPTRARCLARLRRELDRLPKAAAL